MLTAEYVSNAGVILSSGRAVIGIDVLSRDENGLYPATPETEKNKIFERIGQGKLGLLVFTHHHTDHFCAEWVREAAGMNPRLRIIGTKECAALLEEQGVSPEQIRTADPDIPYADGYRYQYGPFSIEAVKTLHEGENYREVSNLMLLIRAEQLLVFPGDSAPGEALFARMARAGTIDWLFAPFPFMGRRLVRQQMEQYLQVRHLFALHLPVPERDTQGWIPSAKRVCEEAKDSLPGTFFPEKPGDVALLC